MEKVGLRVDHYGGTTVRHPTARAPYHDRLRHAEVAPSSAVGIGRGIQQDIQTVRDLSHLVNMLYAACFVAIAYLVGARANEILYLQAGCVKERLEAGTIVGVIVGAIFKKEADYHGRTYEWVAPTPALQAISVLEALSAGSSGERPTATSLCQLAGVSRNTLYADHKDVLHELYKLQPAPPRS